MTTREQQEQDAKMQALTDDLRKANEAATRAAWLKERRLGVGASDVAAILGVDPRQSRLGLYAEKVDALVREETPWMRWGRKAEALVAEAYSDETGRSVIEPEGGPYIIRRHPDVRCLGATLDRLTWGSVMMPGPGGDDAPGPLECKVVAGWNADRWRDEPPVEYQVQLQIQMACIGARWGSLAALVGWPPAPTWIDFPRNDQFISAALVRVEEFWQRVIDRDPPDPEPPTASSALALRALWPTETGESIVLPEGTLELVHRWEAAKARAGAFDALVKDLDNVLRARMRDAAIGLLSDGSFLTLKTTARKAYAVEANTHRTLRHAPPKKAR
jgi:putative phage-type endonuclease